MLTLYLTRHAKSSKDDDSLRDFDRPLNDRGLRDAPYMARVFRKRDEPVDLLMSSPAMRALSTAIAFGEALKVKKADIAREERIYLADTAVLMKVVNALPDKARRVMLFGHNPGFSLLAEQLTDRSSGDLPTCATVRIDFDLDHWEDVSRGTGSLRWIDFPKKHDDLR